MRHREEAPRIVDEERAQTVLDALDDPECRTILDLTSAEALSAQEVAERGTFPLSTVYRKLDVLTDAGLLEARTRVRRGEKHTTEYRRAFDDVVVTVGPCGEMDVMVSQREYARSDETAPR